MLHIWDLNTITRMNLTQTKTLVSLHSKCKYSINGQENKTQIWNTDRQTNTDSKYRPRDTLKTLCHTGPASSAEYSAARNSCHVAKQSNRRGKTANQPNRGGKTKVKGRRRQISNALGICKENILKTSESRERKYRSRQKTDPYISAFCPVQRKMTNANSLTLCFELREFRGSSS